MNPTMMTYATLAVAITCEVIGTSFLQRSDQFTKLVPTLAMAGFYLAAFFFLSQVLKVMPIGIAYAVWSGLGIVLISLVGVVLFKQTLDLAAIVGLGLIVAGVIVVNGFSNSAVH